MRLLATGGTIGTRGSERIAAEEIVRLAPGVTRFARPEAEQFSNVPSTALTLDQSMQLSGR